MHKEKPHISIIVPVYTCRDALPELYQRINETLNHLGRTYELIFINDGCPDNSWTMIEGLCHKHPEIKGINLSRNFGQHIAIEAGLEHAQGEWTIVMDCDLQDAPEMISPLYKTALTGYDIVLGRRLVRKDNFVKRILSQLFYKLLGYLTGTKQDPAIANFGIYSRKVILAICSMKDYSRYFPAMVRWVGFRSTTISVDHEKRKYGKTSYSPGKLIRLGIDVMIAFSDKPLRLAVKFGLFISFISFLIGLGYLFKYIRGDIVVLGYASLIISIWFLSGVIIFVLGVMGLYLGKTFEKVKDRPLYIIEKKINF